MDTVFDVITNVMVWLGDRAFSLLSFFPPLLTLVVISALMGVGMLLVWRYTSNQDAIADVRSKISAHLLATRLFKDDLSVSFTAQRQILWQAMRLLAHSVKPMLIMTAPFVLIVAQIGLRYEFRPAPVEKPTRVLVHVKDPKRVMEVSEQISIPAILIPDPAGPCRAEALGTVDWRLTPTAPGVGLLRFGEDDSKVIVPLVSGNGFFRLSRVCGGGFWDRLLYSALPSIPADSPIDRVEVFYPKRSTPLFGWDVHWLITLILLSIVFAFVFKPFMKVHI